MDTTALVLALASLIIGGGGFGGWIASRAQAKKANSEARQVQVSADTAEARLRPEVDSIAVASLNAAATTLSAENERMSRRLAVADGTIEQQARTIGEQAVTIDRQADTIAEYRQQVAKLTEQVTQLQEALDHVKEQLMKLQRPQEA